MVGLRLPLGLLHTTCTHPMRRIAPKTSSREREREGIDPENVDQCIRSSGGLEADATNPRKSWIFDWNEAASRVFPTFFTVNGKVMLLLPIFFSTPFCVVRLILRLSVFWLVGRGFFGLLALASKSFFIKETSTHMHTHTHTQHTSEEKKGILQSSTPNDAPHPPLGG